MTTSTRAPRSANTSPVPRFTSSVWLVAEREITVRLRSKAFLVSTGILLLAVLASVVVGGILGSTSGASVTKVAAVGSVSQSLAGVAGLEVTTADSTAAAEQLVRDKQVDAAVVTDSSTRGLLVIALDSAPTDLVNALSVTPNVQLLQPPTQNPTLLYLVALGFGLVFFVSAVTFGGTISQSVVEEKQTRVVEILMTTIPVRALLAGKVLGNSILAFGQIAIIALIAGVGLAVSGQAALLGALGPALLWFVVFFAFGFVLLAALFAAAASLVSRQEDMASVTSPVTMLIMLPYFAVIFFNNNPVVLAVMSYVPFAAPVGMPVRIFLGSAQWWEPLLSLVILLVSTAGVIVLGSRVYANSLLRTGARVKLREALRRH